ncbi:phosphatase PAP2 family protein [Fibrella aquatica]|jgi:inositol phosphorylceramide synthase catalytic subunit|uniref:phosphatase PAP2 family protein n=1 Tax=Fibrella aquatica TaxID=3242487 RepID=UPI0035210748
MNQLSDIPRPISRRGSLWLSLATLTYLILSYKLVGFKTDQLVLVGLVNGLYYASEQSRKFIIGFSIFVVYWIVFDYMKAFPNYAYNSVHIESLYNLEKQLFGITTATSILTPNEYWLLHRANPLTIATGIFYLTWVPIPLLFAAWLFVKKRSEFFLFSLTFVLVNLLGFVVYYLYPAAPPWYVQVHGFDFQANTPGNTAGLAQFDQLTGLSVFSSIYAKSSNVFAAMPSLHSSYPVIVLYYGLKNRLGLVNVLFAIVMVGIWFSAVYTSHHYVLDVLAGITCALTGILLFGLLLKTSWLRTFIQRMERLTA